MNAIGFRDSRIRPKRSVAAKAMNEKGSSGRVPSSGIKTNQYIPGFHMPSPILKFLESKNILSRTLRFVRKEYVVRFALGFRPIVLDALSDFLSRWVRLNNPGTLSRKISEKRLDFDFELRKSLIQDLFRVSWYKLNKPDAGSFEFEREFRGLVMTKGARLFADLVLEPWSTIELLGFGTLRVEFIVSQSDYNAIKDSEKYGSILSDLESARFKDGTSNAVIHTLSTETKGFEADFYKFRTVMPVIPCIGDLFFYSFLGTEYIYILNDPRWNSLSLAVNLFFNVHIVDENGSPVGKPFETVERVVTINPDGSQSETVQRSVPKILSDTEIGQSMLRGVYEWFDEWDLGNLQDHLFYIYTGTESLFPDINAGWKGNPAAPNGSGPTKPTPSGPSGQQPPQVGGSSPYKPAPNVPPPGTGGSPPVSQVDTIFKQIADIWMTADQNSEEGRNLVEEGTNSGDPELVKQGMVIQINSEKQKGMAQRVGNFMTDPRFIEATSIVAGLIPQTRAVAPFIGFAASQQRESQKQRKGKQVPGGSTSSKR